MAAESQGSSPAYLITGASGFLGYHLVRQLVEDGASVKIFDLNPPGFDRRFSCPRSLPARPAQLYANPCVDLRIAPR